MCVSVCVLGHLFLEIIPDFIAWKLFLSYAGARATLGASYIQDVSVGLSKVFHLFVWGVWGVTVSESSSVEAQRSCDQCFCMLGGPNASTSCTSVSSCLSRPPSSVLPA